MRNNTAIKLILLVFFLVFFGFLFWFFYSPTEKTEGQKEEETGFFQNLFPFTDSPLNNNKEEDGENGGDQKEKDLEFEEIPRLRQISNIPTSSAFIELLPKEEVEKINKTRDKKIQLDPDFSYFEIRYVAIKNNHVYQTFDFTKKNKRISNITIPRIIFSQFFDKDNFIIKYINKSKEHKTYLVNLEDKSPEEIEIEKKKYSTTNLDLKKFQGIFFPDNILDIFINNKNKKVFYTSLYNKQKEKDGKIYGYYTDIKLEELKKVFDSRVLEWNFSINNTDKIFAYTKNSSSSKSVPISINTENNKESVLKKADVSLSGVASPDFSKIIFSQKDFYNNYFLTIKDLETQKEEVLQISTFAEKCVWSENNIDIYCAVFESLADKENQPESWYKGKNYFKDNILKINTETLEYVGVYNNLIDGGNFDIIDLKLDDTENYIYWKDKKTDFYWSYNLKY